MKLEAVRTIALSLPGAAEVPHFHYTSFRVGGKIFATAPPSGEHIHIFVADEDLELALALYPAFIEKLLWGGKVVGVRVLLAKARAPLIAQLLRKSWQRKAPRKLAQKTLAALK